MADNVAVTAGSGTTIRTDDVGGIQYQVVKVDGGGDGATVPIVAGRQSDSASLPVALSTENAALVGPVTETAPATDIASSGLNGRLQRIAQRLTSLIALLPTALGSGGGLKIDGSGTSLPVTATGSGNFASTVADGANVTLGAKADAKSTATDTTAITIMSVLKQISASAQAPPSQAVTNAGTFATQSAITAASGALASGSVASGAVASGAFASGSIASGALASGSISDGADVTIGTKADAKNAATDTTQITGMSVWKQISASVQLLVTGTVLASGSNTVGKVDILGNGGATLDAVVGAATSPTNMLAVGGVYNSTDLAPTTGQSTALQLDSHGKLKARAEGRLFFATFGTITRPVNTIAYTANDAVSNNGTAGSVTAQTATITDINDDPIAIEYLLLNSTDTGVAGKAFRAWLFRADPTASTGIVGGDNVAFSTKRGSFIGTMSGTFKTFSDGSMAVLAPDDCQRIITTPVASAATIYYLLQTLDAFTPSANSTTFIGTIGGYQGRV